jgi:hypothetical protein
MLLTRAPKSKGRKGYSHAKHRIPPSQKTHKTPAKQTRQMPMGLGGKRGVDEGLSPAPAVG